MKRVYKLQNRLILFLMGFIGIGMVKCGSQHDDTLITIPENKIEHADTVYGIQTVAYHELKGRIVDENDSALSDVSISSQIDVTTTDSLGDFTLNVLDNAPVFLSIRKDGYSDKDSTLSDNLPEETVIDIKLTNE